MWLPTAHTYPRLVDFTRASKLLLKDAEGLPSLAMFTGLHANAFAVSVEQWMAMLTGGGMVAARTTVC